LTTTKAEPPRLPRVFLDADVVVAGSASGSGASHLVLRLGELGLLDLISSRQARDEVERALARKLPSALPAFHALAKAALHWLPDPGIEDLRAYAGEADEGDLGILVAAIGARAEVLLTFNTRHYRPRASVPRIERPGEFLQRLRARLQDLSERPE
jgi:predicted nucleic acid-binding protein